MKNITVAVIDAGGRGSALVKKYAESPFVKKVFAIPGNDGMVMLSKKSITTFPHLKTTDVKEIVSLCQRQHVDFVDVAQDNAVAAGLTDALEEVKIPVIGPTKAAGELEWNKAWAREFMKKYNIPHPLFFVFHSEKDGIDFLKKHKDQKWFVKASGLAEGKGALPARNNKEAIKCIEKMQKFGESGSTYLLEEWLDGNNEEFSAFFLSDGQHVFPIGYAQDHKRAGTFDTGENTGGMGCTSNPLVVTAQVRKQVETIAKKTIEGMVHEGRVYKGILYIGGMLIEKSGKKNVYVIEYNARWGDPEAEVLIPAIKSDLVNIAQSVFHNKLQNNTIKIDTKSRIVVTGAARGYPVDYSNVKGKEIFGLEKLYANKAIIFYPAGIKRSGQKFLVKGGRLFYIVGQGKNILKARQKAYDIFSTLFIEGNNLYYRTDIGWRDVERIYR